MRSYIMRRLLLLFPVVCGVVTFVFLIIHLIPGDPVEIMLGEQALPADKAALRTALGLDKPVLIQYLHFWFRLLQGDLGSSLYSGRAVLVMILERVPATVELTLGALGVAIAIALPLGIVAAVRRYSLWDHGSMLIALLGVSIPNFWLGPLLIILFSLQLGWLPVAGRGGIAHLILPAITLGTALAAILTRMTRSCLLEVLNKGYIVVARAKGVRESLVVGKHALRNSLIPLITTVGLQLGALLSGSIITETIFAWPGLGRLTIQAIQRRDYPLVQGCVLFIALSYVLVNLLVDLLYAYVDPRIRFTKA
ncbi:MAG: ABC transporter permease [Nitrospinota bacterium]|nr:MAG: ABC transporter permease [Nitrospinota bacterium]